MRNRVLVAALVTAIVTAALTPAVALAAPPTSAEWVPVATLLDQLRVEAPSTVKSVSYTHLTLPTICSV